MYNTTTIYHLQANNKTAENLQVLHSQVLCERLSYLETVSFKKICSFPLNLNEEDDEAFLEYAFDVTNTHSRNNSLNEWYEKLQMYFDFYSGSAGDIYIIEKEDNSFSGYLCLPNGWQHIAIQPIQHMLKDAISYVDSMKLIGEEN